MSDCLTRGFRAQLNTSMDSVLRRAVFEIMLIFENSLHDHKRELVQKGEEIAHLKTKLQSAQIKLKERETARDRRAETNKTQKNETRKDPKDVLNAPGQTSDVPEIDFEVPDDWCAPLGSETVTKQEENVCPSIRLRKLTIPLWPIPIIKEEVDSRDIDSHKETMGLRRRTRRDSLLKDRHKYILHTTIPMHNQGTPRAPRRNDMSLLLHDVKYEKIDLTGSTGPKKRGRKRKIATTESQGKESVKDDGEKKYSCKFCKKVFDTEFGRSVHVRSHKKCKGCKREFPFPSALQCHKQSCKKYKKWLAKKAQSPNPPKLESCDKEKPTAPSKTQVIVMKETDPSSSTPSEQSIQKDGLTKKHICVHCNKAFIQRWQLKEHVRVHTGERPFPCSLCSKKFRVNQSLKKHILRIHKGETHSSETNGNLAWTRPLEETENNQEHVMSLTKDTSRAMIHNNIQTDCSPDTSPSASWQTMGTRCANGFMCSLCQKVMTNKYRLIEHYRTHTGEKPIKCEMCPAKFRFRGQLSIHKKKCRNATTGTKCFKCKKKFFSQEKCNKHVSKCHRDVTLVCKVCGKLFFYKGRLKNHMERVHP